MRRPHPVVVLLGSVLLAAACGSSSSPAPAASPEATASVPPPTATPSPTPSPSPSPSITTAFLRKLVSAHAGMMAVSGTLAISALSGTVSGQFDLSGADSSSTLTVSMGAITQTSSQVDIGSTRYEQKAGGPWLEVAKPPSSSASLGSTIAAIASLQDLGIVTKNGRPLHHLQPKGGGAIPSDVLGLDQAARNPAFTMDFYAEDDGTPAIMEISGTWTTTFAGQDAPANMDLLFDLSKWGTNVVVTPPTDVWETNTSKANGYSMAYPRDWTVTALKSGDEYLFGGQAYVYVYRDAIPKSTSLDRFRDAVASAISKQVKTSPDGRSSAMLGGQPAWRLTYHFRNASKQDLALVEYVTVHGGAGYEVFMTTRAGDGEASDITTFETFVSTFAFAS